MAVPPHESDRRCPVCVGTRMRRLTPDGTVMLDYCPRCNGVWCDRGEAAALRDCRPSGSPWPVAARDTYAMKCHGCGGPMDRDADACGVCARPNLVDCPVCRALMEVATHNDLRLDVCRRCLGIWFDANELTRLWNGTLREDANAIRPPDDGWNALMLGVDPDAAAAMAAKGFDANAAAAIAAGRGQRDVADDPPRGVADGADASTPLTILGVVADILFLLTP